MVDLFRFVMLRPPDDDDNDDGGGRPDHRRNQGTGAGGGTADSSGSSRPTTPGRSGGSAEEARKRRDEVLTRYRRLEEAYRILTHLEPDDLVLTAAPQPAAAELPEPAFNEIEQALRAKAGALVHEQIGNLDSPDSSVEERIGKWRGAHQFALTERIGSPEGAMAPFIGAAPADPTQLNVRTEALGKFSAELHAALGELDVALDRTSVPVAADRLKEALIQLTPEAMAATRALHPQLIATNSVVPIGQQFFAASDIVSAQAVELPTGDPAPLPSTSLSARPVVVGDLLVVRQQLTGYAKGEVAYIENILRGESYKRGVTRMETVEETTFTETESFREETRDLQATDRFELKRESQNVVTLDGIVSRTPQSPNYGPVVEFQNNPESQLHGSQQLSEKRAETYGRDVTNRATSRVSDRVRTQITRRVLRQFEEKSEHAFANDKTGAENVVGIYQWIDKVYEAQIYNYGRRLFYDFVVPEPAAFLLQAFARDRAEGQGLTKPVNFAVLQPDGTERPLQPDDITETNYTYLTGVYQATGVKAPPQSYVTVSKTFVSSTPLTVGSLELAPPDGYSVARSMISMGYFDPVIPTKLDVRVSKGDHWHASLGCQRTRESYEQWQLATYEALLRSARQREDAYHNRLASLEAALRVGAVGQTPDQKRQLERTELKKSCITLLSEQHFDAFNGIESTFPQPDLTVVAAQGRFIRFFEQALEWEQMAYRFYPYFWSRKANWMKKVDYDDADAQFSEFLKAGAARVLLPIRPGFERAMIHFVETSGEIWEGDDDPPIVSDIYQAALEEIDAASAAEQTPTPYGEAWEVRLPTTLVMLREEAELPKWKKVGGKWVPDE